MIHLWSIRRLSENLAAEQVTDRQGMHYFLASSLLILVQTQYLMWSGRSHGWLFWFEFIVIAVAAIIGCLECYKANNDRSFAFRAICLSVPAGLQVFVFSSAFGFAFQYSAPYILDYETFKNPMRAYNVLSYAAFIGFSIYFWVLIHKGFSTISSKQAAYETTT